jgi:hypothetical protein
MDDSLIEWLMERMDSSGKNRESSHAVAPNSFGAGYDLGFYEALREVLTHVTEPPLTRA